MPRTAIPTSSVAPTGVSALMPPHSQGAERRTERHGRCTTSRWRLRALVIGGLAGAAWLLTGAAAHAADRDPAPEGAILGSSLIGSVVQGDAAQSAVTRVLQAAARPLESDRAADQHHRTTSFLAAPVTTLTSTLGESVVRELTGTLRLTGGPADSSLTMTLRPVTDLLPHEARPAATTQRPVAAPAVRRTTVARRVADTGPASNVPVIGSQVDDLSTVSMADTASVPHVAAADRNVAHPHSATAMAAERETFPETTPGGDGPAPLQVHLGAVSGFSTSGSGAPTEGGSAAFLPAAVAAGTVAFHRLPLATDVEVRRHDAEAPTVSPD
jgi:hypothetical protein